MTDVLTKRFTTALNMADKHDVEFGSWQDWAAACGLGFTHGRGWRWTADFGIESAVRIIEATAEELAEA